MKNYIALSILLSLMSGKRYSAPCLAEKYETSIKTIYRSIDILLEAGMPITSISGKGGGYELIGQSQVSSFFTKNELTLFLSFLKSSKKLVGSLGFDERLNMLDSSMQKLNCESDNFVIDVDSWGNEQSDGNLINIIKNAIGQTRQIKIWYPTGSNICVRVINPYSLVYKSGTFYVYAFCKMRNSFRLFKITRIKKLELLNSKFDRQNIDLFSKPWNKDFQQNLEPIIVKIKCKDNENDIKEWLGDSKVMSLNDGYKLVEGKANYSIGLVHKIMELGNFVKVLGPQKLCDAIVNECNKIKSNYI